MVRVAMSETRTVVDNKSRYETLVINNFNMIKEIDEGLVHVRYRGRSNSKTDAV